MYAIFNRCLRANLLRYDYSVSTLCNSKCNENHKIGYIHYLVVYINKKDKKASTEDIMNLHYHRGVDEIIIEDNRRRITLNIGELTNVENTYTTFANPSDPLCDGYLMIKGYQFIH